MLLIKGTMTIQLARIARHFFNRKIGRIGEGVCNSVPSLKAHLYFFDHVSGQPWPS